MSIIVPDKLPKSASRGEERTYSILKKLPDDYFIYYEPVVNNRRPDFIIIAPEMGVMVIEVKGWYPGDILGGNDSEIHLDDNGKEHREIHPVEQARRYMWELVNICKRNPESYELLNRDGRYKNKFIFPFGHLAILSNITYTQLQNHETGDLTKIFRDYNVICRDVLLKWESEDEETIVRTIRQYFDPFWLFPKLDKSKIDIIRAIIHPEIVIQRSKELDKTLPGGERFSLKVLDYRQENNARKINEGHRIIYGVAGSGKTILLIARARLFSESFTEKRGLFLCYNFVLSIYIREMLKDCQNIDVLHFDGWSKKNYIVRSNIDGILENHESLGERLLNKLAKKEGDFGRYNAAFIDEAQDFHPKWFQCILKALKDPNEDDLLIVCDGNQGIYSTGKISWKSVGIQAQGRSISTNFDLDKNYRNTREILALASIFASCDQTSNEDGFGIVPICLESAIRSNNILPMLVHCKDHEDECQKILSLVTVLLNPEKKSKLIPNGLKPEDIGILYPAIPFKDKAVFEKLMEELSKIAPIVWISDKKHPEARKKILDKSIKIQTVHSAKGLQYRATIIMWADHFQTAHIIEHDRENSLIYTALTRAEDFQAITYSERTPMIEKIIDSKLVYEYPSKKLLENFSQ